MLERARRAAPLPVWQNAFLEARLEPDGDRVRVLVDGADVGTLATPAADRAATVPAKLERNRRDAPLELSVRLGSPG